MAVGCQGNYRNTTYVRVFQFPPESDEERRRKWIQFTSREGWTPTKSSVFCINHFSEKYIQRQENGFIKLSKLAIPSIQCETVPKYLNRNVITRKLPEQREVEIETRNRANEIKFQKRDLVGDKFTNFKEEIASRLNYFSWQVEISDTYVAFYKYEFVPRPKVCKCIIIDETLKLETFVDGTVVKKACKNKLDRWSVLENFLKQCDKCNKDCDQSDGSGELPEDKCRQLITENFKELLHYYESNEVHDDTKVKRMKFLAE